MLSLLYLETLEGLDQHPELLNPVWLTAFKWRVHIDQFELDFLRFKVPPQ
ncbi:hypothetical protein O9992_14555 [Vibrio lentus]|nr:hypothetical protein [Vibrio lentus]